MFKRIIKCEDKEEVYLEALKDMNDNKIINDKTFENVLGYNKSTKEKDDYEH